MMGKQKQRDEAHLMKFNQDKQEALDEIKGSGHGGDAPDDLSAPPYQCGDCERGLIESVQKGLERSADEIGWVQGACRSYFNCVQKIPGHCEGTNGTGFYLDLLGCTSVEQVKVLLSGEKARLEGNKE